MSNSNLHCLKVQGPRAFKHFPLFFASLLSFLFESYLERAFKTLWISKIGKNINWYPFFSYFWALRAQKRPPPLPPPSPSLNARGGRPPLPPPSWPPLGSSVWCQVLVLVSPFFQVIFMKNHAKNPLFEGLCYNNKGLELFSKTNFESSWAFEGPKICKIM